MNRRSKFNNNNNGNFRGYKKQKKQFQNDDEQLESKLGFSLFTEGDTRLGWLLTFSSSSCEDEDTGKTYSCVDLYFVTQDATYFKVKYKFQPYFYAATKDKMEMDVEAYLRRRFESQIASVEIVEKEDLNLKNHLSGLHKSYLKISFDTVQQLMEVKRDLFHVVHRNQEKSNTAEAYEAILVGQREQRPQDFLECIIDLREYDVPYHVRFAIDTDVRCGQWYDVSISSTGAVLEKRAKMLQRAEVRICAFDIETTKLPLKFPDPEYDMVMMISYMVDGKGYLIVNRECVAEDIDDIEYTPKPEFEGFFQVTNVTNEVELLKKWFAHMQKERPGIYVTYNGDFFDWPFLESRAAHHGFKMSDELGFQCDKIQGECRAKFACHLDAFAWVKRDSYLPQGSQGLKAVTKAKLGYDPLEVNPEDMVRYAKEKPQMMASYSVSDAVSTYYLYMTYVHPFIFSLATIIPMSPDEVLRKGSGTLCEMLLMVQAYKANVICPNKHLANPEKFHSNRLLDSETYIGGHVECLESGVFRSDLPTNFKLDKSAYQQLIKNLDRDLQYAIKVEGKMDLDLVSNYDEVKGAIEEKLVKLQEDNIREECPLIYHLDVAAMYPNIILTNRLQPPSIVTDEVCTACDFNRPGKTCLRKLEWVWRGEVFMASKSDYYHLKKQIESEFIESGGQSSISYLDLPKGDQQLKLKERLKKYCQKAYKRVLDKPSTEVREAGICMRENPFYVDTVRSFRDRRYEYKGEVKRWKGKLAEAKAGGNPLKIQEAQDMVVLYDSLQLAHKCILNSFYGYVMRKGARWYSMEMAGVVTYTGAKIIQNAHLLIEKIGKPLELDTDGIWCALPGSFPENFTFRTKDSNKKLTISYPCVMLNVDVAMNNTNDQYQTLTDAINKTYSTQSECSIEFEVDGPYKAMILPASTKEGILLKKRYAVFNDDGTLAELKGFEIKRRGELKLIKVFQAEVFDKFLHGSTLEECYSAVASVANRWLDLLDNQGRDIADSELLDYISESNTMSKSLAEYGQQKSCAVTTARRLADFLGDSMVKDKGLRCQYVIACEPQGTDVSQRAIPVAIFETDPEIMKNYVRKWCKMSSEVGIRSIIDWSYYRQRLSSTIQKIITIPAAMQKVSNPVPRVVHPDWLHKKIREKEDKFRQKKLVDMYGSWNKVNSHNDRDNNCNMDIATGDQEIVDLEDCGNKNEVNEGHKANVSKYKSDQIDSQQILSDHSETLHKDSLPTQDNSHSPKSIDKNTDYHGWLETKKRKWKELLNKRKKQSLRAMKSWSKSDLVVTIGLRENILARLVDSRTSNNIDGVLGVLEGGKNRKGGSAGTGVSSYFKRPEVALTRCHWQIIQLVPNLKNGELLAWVLVEGFMIKVPITVPRVFYLNSKAPGTEEFPGRRVNKTLPHGKRSYSLIEVIIDEDQYRAERKKLAALLADPEVEGMYETKVPLDFNAIIQIGCVCKVDKSASKRNVQDGWILSELNMRTTTECSYLDQSISFFHLYHSISEGRGLYIKYFPVSKEISVVVVNPYQNKDLSPSFLERQHREACQLLSIEPPPRTGISFKVEYVGHVEDAHRILQRGISEYRQQHGGATIALIECPDAQLLKRKIRALDDFPCIVIPYNARDSHYQVLGWQQLAAKTGMQRCAASIQWLNEKIAISKYTHIPLGNHELDWVIFAADVFFSRALRDHQQVLWISDDGIPDLGGISDEDACFADEVHQSVMTHPGAYRRVTVELKIHNLAVNALLKSHQLDELEGGSLLEFEQGSEQYEFDEATSCQPAFRVLKQLIQRCLADAVTSGNVFADAVLQHLYRWLCSPKSKLHDPALHRVLHKAMKKVFALLLSEMRKLGSTIIFADFSKIIIDTGKYHLSAAKDYCDILLKTLQARDLFEWIELEPLHFWHSLLFMDQYNYGAIPANPDENVVDESQADIVSSWNMAEYLPKSVQDHFIFIVTQFMYLPWKHAQEQASRQNSTLGTQSITVAAAECLEANMSAYLKEQINSYFTDTLLGIVNTVLHLRRLNRSDHDQHVSAAPLNTSDGKGDAALEFIKYVCVVLSLDGSVEHDVLVMKKNLLRYVHVREFAPEAEFRDPSRPFTLPNVICSYCNDCRDLNLCRDSTLLAQEWRCAIPLCGQPYDPEVMENALLQVVRQRERLYHLQDLECKQCKQVKAVHLADQCHCGGKFKCKEEAVDFRDKMQIFLNIAEHQNFQLLKECALWILEVGR